MGSLTLNFPFGPLVHRRADPSGRIGERRQQVEATFGQVVILERIGIGKRFEIEVADPKAQIPFRPVFINGLHTFAQRGKPDSIDATNHFGRTGGELHRSSGRRRNGTYTHSGEIELKAARHTQQFDFDIAESHAPVDRHGNVFRTSHHRHDLILQPPPAQSSGIRIERSGEFGRHLAESEPETGRGVRPTVGMQRKREIPRDMPAEIDDYRRSTPFVGYVIKLLHISGRFHPPPLKGRRIAHRTDEPHGFNDRLLQHGLNLLRDTEPPGTLRTECDRRILCRNGIRQQRE